MSVMVQANGAQREIGMYAGVDGAVRKLFDEIGISNPYGVSGTEAGIQENVPFDVSGYTLVIAQVYVGHGDGNRFQFLVILPKWKLSYKLKAYGEQQPVNVTMSNSISDGDSSSYVRRVDYDSVNNTLTTSQPINAETDMVWLYA